MWKGFDPVRRLSWRSVNSDKSRSITVLSATNSYLLVLGMGQRALTYFSHNWPYPNSIAHTYFCFPLWKKKLRKKTRNVGLQSGRFRFPYEVKGYPRQKTLATIYSIIGHYNVFWRLTQSGSNTIRVGTNTTREHTQTTLHAKIWLQPTRTFISLLLLWCRLQSPPLP